ncbi:Gfo/Idh/MocA family protein [Notoacmeibacter sp. MSK16QG-6]|uniref:Gfo/Idh/MocA family protein n=1 Tax=Notoacmeibacter sp. MSK16QG-6 TaxID=2957982 RepID=UPI0020A0A1BD|nr:Gfo/Idh/MocA family oxidoreductase [Notoacmeibacter sp. MSK16QG-6]MCP1200263.1 Gfo/Idh/MocA family oxidoreductase [Notoacmeibacter sp. MSK16QG-6]
MAIDLVIVGVGKIAKDQHLPAIGKNSDYRLVAAISRNAAVEDVENFETIDDWLATGQKAAVSLCVPPSVRTEIARKVIAAGCDLMIEKPPAATLGEIELLRSASNKAGTVLYATWHSRRAAAVDPARRWLEKRSIRSVKISWRENVRQWHPGQDWVFKPGGFGVFDPGINALSILTEILPERVIVESARLSIPENRATPIAGDVAMRHKDCPIHMTLDWLQEGEQTWTITVETDDGPLDLTKGGAALSLAGKSQELERPGEYDRLYADFARLIQERQSDVDTEPLRIVADAMMTARIDQAPPFHF